VYFNLIIIFTQLVELLDPPHSSFQCYSPPVQVHPLVKEVHLTSYFRPFWVVFIPLALVGAH